MTKKVLILSSIEGHASLAEAAAYALTNDFQITIKDLTANWSGYTAYKAIYRFTPSLFQIPFKISQNQKLQTLLKHYFSYAFKNKTMKLIEQVSPDIIITTHFIYLPILDNYKPKGVKHINIISDPITIHPITFSFKADYNLGFDETSIKLGRQLGISRSRLRGVGWLTRPGFYQISNQEKVRRALGLDDKLTFLICSGSEGTNTLISLLPTLFLNQQGLDYQLIFVTGSNRLLFKLIKESYKLTRKVKTNLPKIHVLGFTKNMPDYMTAADVVVGKAGPNLIFESIAKKKPFIAFTHIVGQEDGNLDLIRNYNIGWVTEKITSFKTLWQQILTNPSILKEKRPYITKLRNKNRSAGKQLNKLAKELVNELY